KRRLRRKSWLDPTFRAMDGSDQPTGNATPADINRNGRPTSIGMGGRHPVGITGRLRRNPPKGASFPGSTASHRPSMQGSSGGYRMFAQHSVIREIVLLVIVGCLIGVIAAETGVRILF